MRRNCLFLFVIVLQAISVAPVAAGEPVRTAVSVAIWSGSSQAGIASLEPLAQELRAAGITVRTIAAEELVQGSVLDPKKLDLFVLNEASRYPALGLEVLDRFLAGGGSLLSLGGPILTEPLFRSPRGWLTRLQLVLPGHAPLAIDGKLGESLGREQLRAKIQAITDPQDRPGWNVEIPDLRSYYYATLPLEGKANYALLHFRARGDAATPWLCIELNETDKSRWKAVVPLSAEWRDYEISPADLISYANDKRGQAGDYFHSERAVRLSLGFPASLVGNGRHAFEVAGLAWHASDVEPQQWAAASRFHPHLAPLRKAFGSQLQPAAGGSLPDALRFNRAGQGVVLRPAPGQPFLMELPPTAAGLWLPMIRLHNLDLLGPPGKPTHGIFLPSKWLAREIPLLLADKQPALGLWVHVGRPYAGGRWVVSGLPSASLPVDKLQVAQGLARLVTAMIARPLLTALEPRYLVDHGQVRMELMARIDPGRHFRGTVELSTQVVSSSQSEPQCRQTHSVELRGRAAQEIVVLQADPNQFDWKRFRAECQLACNGDVCDRMVASLDVQGVLKAVCDHLVATQRRRGDGRFSGTSFVDNRGARGLLAASDLFQQPEYLRAAVAWGEAMIAAQRPDGGYAMGYGGEACYVADGGEIACGIARLVSYVPAAERRRYFDSLRAYMGFRDGFRCAGGGIGVGWCLHDYAARPVRPLDKLTRIYAPEQNLYTIGCTLASACMFAAATGDARDREAAASDARWWLARTATLSPGASMESAIWAHHLLPDEDLRRGLAEALRTRFLPKLLEPGSRWWTTAGGRAVQGMEGLAWCYEHLGRDPAVAAALMNAAYQVCSEQSLAGIPPILRKPKISTADWYYLNFAAVSLPELIQPGLARKPLPVCTP